MWYFVDNYKLEILFIIFGVYNYFIKQPNIRLLKTQIFIVFLGSFFSVINYFFDVYENSLLFQFQTFYLIFIIITKLILSIKSDKINKKNVCLIFYEDLKTLKQNVLSSFGLNVASAGLIMGDDLFQLRYEFPTVQKLAYTEDYIYSKYLVIDTGFPISELKGDWESELLKQKARQPRTLWFRLNCLNTLEFVINQIPDYKFKYETLPSIYLLKLKIKGII